jgi:two-component system, LuxR family, response regulator DctR
MAACVYLIDDDDAIRDALGWLFLSRKIPVQSYASAEEFLAQYPIVSQAHFQGCLLVDIRMPGMGGLGLFDELLRLHCQLPVLFLTGHGDVPMAVGALKKGAWDFLEKPFNDNELVDRVISAMAHDEERYAAAATMDDLALRKRSLTVRERQVMDLILSGKQNKLIADELQISMRTVEVHRSKLFEKMGVKTAVDLAGLVGGVIRGNA